MASYRKNNGIRMNQDACKQRVAKAAIQEIDENTIIGVGTGSTVNFFIAELAKNPAMISGAVPSSLATERLLREANIPIIDSNAGPIHTYIDGADECNNHCQLIKGGGGALTREKVVAAMSQHFICIIDESKRVAQLGADFPLPIEVLPFARSYVAREIVKLGGDPVLRDGVKTDNGHMIIDVFNLTICEPIALEQKLNNITGIVCNGLFAMRGADKVLVANDERVDILVPR